MNWNSLFSNFHCKYFSRVWLGFKEIDNFLLRLFFIYIITECSNIEYKRFCDENLKMYFECKPVSTVMYDILTGKSHK